jgi:hypothetical protein
VREDLHAALFKAGSGGGRLSAGLQFLGMDCRLLCALNDQPNKLSPNIWLWKTATAMEKQAATTVLCPMAPDAMQAQSSKIML